MLWSIYWPPKKPFFEKIIFGGFQRFFISLRDIHILFLYYNRIENKISLQEKHTCFLWEQQSVLFLKIQCAVHQIFYFLLFQSLSIIFKLPEKKNSMFRQNSYSIRRHIAKHENPELSSIGSHRIFRRKRHKIWYSGLCDRRRQQKMSFAMFNIANKQLQKISYFYVGTKMRESLAQKLHTQAEHLFHNNKTVHAPRSASYLEWSAEFNLNFVPIRMLQFERFNMWKFCNQWSTVVEIVKPYTCGWWFFEMF